MTSNRSTEEDQVDTKIVLGTYVPLTSFTSEGVSGLTSGAASGLSSAGVGSLVADAGVGSLVSDAVQGGGRPKEDQAK